MKGKRLNPQISSILIFLACFVAAFVIWLYFNIYGGEAQAALTAFRGL